MASNHYFCRAKSFLEKVRVFVPDFIRVENFNARNPKIDFRKSIIAKIGFRKSIFGFRAIRVNPSNPSRPQIIACNDFLGETLIVQKWCTLSCAQLEENKKKALKPLFLCSNLALVVQQPKPDVT